VKKHLALLTLASVVGFTGAVSPVYAADRAIAGTKIVLRDPVLQTQRRFNFLSKDSSITFGSNADSDTPTVNGASVLLFNATSGECQCIILPAYRWAIGGAGNRYLYRDPAITVSPVKIALIKDRKLKVVAAGTGLTGVTLDEITQGEMAVHYTSGTGNKLCSTFSASSVRHDQPGAYIAVNSTAPGACAVEPVACTPCVPPIVP